MIENEMIINVDTSYTAYEIPHKVLYNIHVKLAHLSSNP